MLFNLLCGVNYEMKMVSGSFEGIDSPRVLTVNKTVDPLALIIKTSVGSSGEMIAYCREKPADGFFSAASGSAPVTCRLLGEYGAKLLLTVHGASAASCADVEYYILGVKRQ